jgi:enamine deaminase RidA (YjgF/YER057c/UK114 family)
MVGIREISLEGKTLVKEHGGRVEDQLKGMGLGLPEAKTSSKIAWVQVCGDLVYCSGHGSENADGELKLRGQVGSDLTLEQGYEAARNCALNTLASLKRLLGSLDRIRRIIKVTGFVNCDSRFSDQPAVINGYTDLMNQLFPGKHARSAVGANGLPNNQAVEVETIVELDGPIE